MNFKNRSFLHRLTLLLPIILFVVFLNARVDPAHLFQEGYERGIAELLLSRSNVANVSNYNDRLVQKFYIEGLHQGYNVTILGSSRAMAIHSYMVRGRTFFNHSVSGASLQDHVAILELYALHQLRMNTIIIELDPWLLNANNGQQQWLELSSEYHAAIRRLGLSPGRNNMNDLDLFSDAGRYFELISPSYFQESWRIWLLSLRDPDSVPGDYYPTSEVVGQTAIRLSDGSLSPGIQERSAESPNVNVQNAVITLRNFNRLDPDLKRLFETQILSLQDDGVTVLFLLTPYHPDAYEFLIQSLEYGMLVEAQKYFTEFAAAHGIILLGSYNPVEAGCTGNEFYDEQHPREECFERILAHEDW